MNYLGVATGKCIALTTLHNNISWCGITMLIIHQIFSLTGNWSNRVTWPNIPQLKLGNIREYSPIFKTSYIAKKIWRIIKTIAPIWGENMLPRIIVLGHYLFCIAHSSRKTVRFLEQIMSADKYPGIFLRQMVTTVYIWWDCIQLLCCYRWHSKVHKARTFFVPDHLTEG